MRTDPSDTGGLFVRRRPGTAPVKYRTPPQPAGAARRRADAWVANGMLALMVLINLMFWGPIPAAWLWIGSQVNWLTGSVTLGITTAFAGLLATLFGGLALLKRLDDAWILVRRAAGIDQRRGALPRVFAATAAVGAAIFAFWFIVIVGPGPTFAPRN